jgi:hypothetical protein
MLSPDQAEQRLEEMRDERWLTKRRTALARLTKPLSSIGLALLPVDEEDGGAIKIGDSSVETSADTACRRLIALNTNDRRKILDVLFPKFSRRVEDGLQLHRRVPYQTGYARKAFRAASKSNLCREAQGSWLMTLLARVQGHDQDLAWLAAWAPHLTAYYSADALGILFAAAIEKQDQEADTVYEILCDSARGEHEIGGMGRHVSRALLVAERPEGWEFMEKMLLAAQRQEGLRQVILESIDEAHPEAFRRMLRLLLEHDLARFSSVVRALNVWFDFMWDSASPKVVNESLALVLSFLEDDDARAKALHSGDGNGLYLALWTLGFRDAVAAVNPAALLLQDKKVERRFVAARFLSQLRIPQAQAKLARALNDDDLRVALTAYSGLAWDQWAYPTPREKNHELFEQTERILARLPAKKTKLDPLVWPWCSMVVDAEGIARSLVWCLGNRPATRLLSHLPRMDSYARSSAVRPLAEQKRWDHATRGTLFQLVGDTSSKVREEALNALSKCNPSEDEARGLEAHLNRKPADLRRAVVTLLLNRKDEAVLASAARLLAEGDSLCRLGGLELIRQLAEAKRQPDVCRRLAEDYRARQDLLDPKEESQLATILDTGRKVFRLDDALGLMNPADRTKPKLPIMRGISVLTPAALACLQSLDALIHEKREAVITVETWEGPKQELLGNAKWVFPSPQTELPLGQDCRRFPLREVFENWRAEREKKLRDADGLELLRARFFCEIRGDGAALDLCSLPPQSRKAVAALAGDRLPRKLRYVSLVKDVLDWLLRLHPLPQGLDFCLDLAETSLALIPRAELAYCPAETPPSQQPFWRRYNSPFLEWQTLLRHGRHFWPEQWTGQHAARLWEILRWVDEPAPGIPRDPPDFDVVLDAYVVGAATRADLLDHLLGPRYGTDFSSLESASRHKLDDLPKAYDFLPGLVEECRRRILEIEVQRGESPTAASLPATALRSIYGVNLLVCFLRILGKEALARSSPYDRPLSRQGVFSHLVEVTYPRETDTPESFASQMKRAGIPEVRLIELAFHAPQWVSHVELCLGWPGFAEGVWWFIAHSRYGDPGEEQEAWERRIRERTPLTPEELCEGAVDVAWFQSVWQAVGPRRWNALRDACKYGCSGQGHRQALLLSDVLLGKAKKADIVASIRQKQRRDAVRLLGLLPLAKGKGLAKDLQDRYQVLQEYLAYARKLSAMTKDSALRAQQIGVNNLARTAGHVDPLRFEWAMETEAIADLAEGPVCIKAGGVDVTLTLDELGQPELTVAKQGKRLKSIPAEARKTPKIAALIARKTELKKQASRIRQSLEAAMCRGDQFAADELRRLFHHPVLQPKLERLILVGEGILGYPVSAGKALRDHAGKVEPIKEGESLRIAHAHDLLQSGAWHQWQHDCFAAERVQPFKQVFREVYVVTDQERTDGTISRRYAGQQVNPRQATSLWGSRGWSVKEEDGIRRTFHEAGWAAWVTLRSGVYTPLEVEGWTLEGVRFSRKGEWDPLHLTDVPPRIFSEVMRDLDLVVSVAHRGGVDPEASASTVDMRAALLGETLHLLKIDNVRVKDSHALIDGQLANYNVHLGSAVVHLQPGGHLCLVPVHAEHRGRLFLPFADDDPRTAEVLSKVILLARDQEIQDPNILDQIRSIR